MKAKPIRLEERGRRKKRKKKKKGTHRKKCIAFAFVVSRSIFV